MKRILALLAAVMMLVSCCTALADSEPTGVEDGVFTIAMECAYAPYNWTQTDDSNGAVPIKDSSDYANGYDVMIAKKICEANGWQLEILRSDWDSLVPAVQTGMIDAAIAGQSMTAARSEQVDFAGPYFYASIVCVTKADSQFADAQSISDLSGGTCTAQIATIWYDQCLPQIQGAQIQTAAETAPAMLMALETGTVGYRARKRLETRDIDLYVGIPFCPTRCAYCSFVSQSVERSFSLVEPYVKALIAEIRAGGEMARKNRLRPRTFYMGGGTPTTLTADQMDAVLTALEESFDLSACPELTVEAGRPDTITAEKLAVLKCHGVTRVSVNPQTMEDRVLAAIGRRHTAVETEQAMELVRAYHFPHVNMDLIAGLPEDTPEGFRRSLDKCLELGASNITVHTLALKKGSRILTEGLSIPDGAAVQAMLDYAAPTLRRAGFAPYYLYRQKYMSGSFENVGWCRPGGECWYNVDIMSELCSILSFGAGGSTKMVEPGTNHIERVFNVKYPKEYTERPEKTLQNQAAFAEFYAKYVPEA